MGWHGGETYPLERPCSACRLEGRTKGNAERTGEGMSHVLWKSVRESAVRPTLSIFAERDCRSPISSGRQSAGVALTAIFRVLCCHVCVYESEMMLRSNVLCCGRRECSGAEQRSRGQNANLLECQEREKADPIVSTFLRFKTLSTGRRASAGLTLRSLDRIPPLSGPSPPESPHRAQINSWQSASRSHCSRLLQRWADERAAAI